MAKLLLFFVLVGCSQLQPISSPTHTDTGPEAKLSSVPSSVWYLEHDVALNLIVQNMDSKEVKEIKLIPGLNQLPLKNGFWRLQKMKSNRGSYSSVTSDKKFIFTVKKGMHTYTGTLLWGCPKIPNSKLSVLKGMKFFNRFTFFQGQKLCELIVGNNFDQVQEAFQKRYKNKGLKLANGL